MKIKIFTTGGTLDKIYFDDLSTYEVGKPRVGEILKTAKVNFEYTIEEIFRKDSLQLTSSDRQNIKQRVADDPSRFILITHGTDSMTLTADTLKDIPDKVIVLTGAIKPYLFKQSDATFNVGCAIGAMQALSPGVYIAMSGLIFKAGEVKKNRDKERFEATG
ncbi:MAG: asparaginase [Deltaproteobacteria bacterium]|nr:MAG: asparaginase [Deltaproteobacteria bacterium]RTZ98460.1 MAG: asparaginase [Deltaproteobacteria bacterium]